MKKSNYLLSLLLIIMSVFMIGTNVFADEEDYTESNKNSVVQVVSMVTLESGEMVPLKSGSGVVINSTTVITDYNVLHLSKKALSKCKKFIKDTYKVDVDFSKGASINVVVVDKGDKKIETTVMNESKEDQFSILTLSSEIDRPAAAIGDSSTMEVTTNVIALGYPTVDTLKKKGEKIFSETDINFTPGMVSEISDKSFRVGTKISQGNSGGALLDASSGVVVGIALYTTEDNQKECFRAIPINYLKGFLDKVAYTDVGAINNLEQVEVVEPEEIPIDRGQLELAISKAKLREATEYTEESYSKVTDCVTKAESVLNNEDATQEEIDQVCAELNQSIEQLEVAPKTNWTLIIIIAVCVVLVIIIIVLIIVFVVISRKNKNNVPTRPQAMGMNPNMPQMGGMGGMPNMPGNVGPRMGGAPVQGGGGSQGTTVLRPSMTNNSPGTTVLNAGTAQIAAYLVRRNNNESTVVDGKEFTMGKDPAMVDYCVSGNDAISRCHAKIVKKGVNYVIVDMGSTNCTYVNGERVMPQKEKTITSGDTITLADEEFTFEIK